MFVLQILSIADRASKLGKKIKLLQINDLKNLQINKKNYIQFVCVTKCNNLTPGKIYKSNADYVLQNLDFGIDNALNDKKIALVTGPISKENIISINKKFQGFKIRYFLFRNFKKYKRCRFFFNGKYF